MLTTVNVYATVAVNLIIMSIARCGSLLLVTFVFVVPLLQVILILIFLIVIAVLF
jgi:hypothetical protein